jgi:hypothetical protein
MLYQLHWQDGNPQSPTHLQTSFVAQSEDVVDVAGADSTWDRFRKIVDERRAECPKDWSPMICDQGAKEFVLAPA